MRLVIMTHATRSHSFVTLCALAAILSVASVTHGDHDRHQRVVGGFNATQGQFKYVVSLQIFNQLHYCGGAILTPRTILTAAHCRKSFEIYAMTGSVYYKDHSAKRYRVREFIVHESYNSVTLNYDVALAILDDDIEFNEYVQPIRLAAGPAFPGERMTLSGWGYVSHPPPPEGPPNRMQWMETNVVDREICDEYHPGVETHICIYEAVNHGICSGDSGGPLANADGALVGVISAGYPCAIGYPDSCTDVFMMRDWILEHMV